MTSTDGPTYRVRRLRGERRFLRRRPQYEVTYTPAGATQPEWSTVTTELLDFLRLSAGLDTVDATELMCAADAAWSGDVGEWVTSPPWRCGAALATLPHVLFRRIDTPAGGDRGKWYELRVDDGPIRTMHWSELYTRLRVARYPADFSPGRRAAEEMYQAGDRDGWVSYLSGGRV